MSRSSILANVDFTGKHRGFLELVGLCWIGKDPLRPRNLALLVSLKLSVWIDFSVVEDPRAVIETFPTAFSEETKGLSLPGSLVR